MNQIQIGKTIAILPARGGSKGIPRKNIQDFGGVPLLGHKIQQAVNAGINEVWVSTDDREISEVATKFGAQVINRPSIFAQDTSSTDDVLNHALDTLKPNDQDQIVLLQVTSPLIRTKSIQSCIRHLNEHEELNCVISVHESHPFLWTQDSEKSENWNPKNHSREHRPRRQDLASEGWETGGCYVIRVNALKAQSNRYPSPTGTVNVGFLESVDVDTWEDLEEARLIFKMFVSKIILE